MTEHVEGRPIIIGSRGSKLALWQANFVAEKLRATGQTIEVKTWKTTGDMVQDRFLHEIGGKGLFIKELEEAMLRGEADLAVHSLKDLPAKIPPNFELASILKRHSSRDVIIFKKEFYSKLGISSLSVIDSTILKDLGPITVATSSLRRTALLKNACPEITAVPVRGNVDTRLKKLETEPWQALVLAEASLERLSINDVCAHPLDPAWFIPCPGQGAIAIETPKNSRQLSVLSTLQCEDTRFAVDLERKILARLGGDCTMPFGCLVTTDHEQLENIKVSAIVLDQGGNTASAVASLPKTTPQLAEKLEECVITELRQNGVNKILKSLQINIQI
jgi:hydroxymethylbilane synthase